MKNLPNKTNLLVICGPTATGKTDLGIELSKRFNGEIISADSRQIYKGMTIGTGKKYSSEVAIWGYDLVSPTEDFSVSHFRSFAQSKINEIALQDKLPILVGGTGLYIKSVIEPMNAIDVPLDDALRTELENKSVEELQVQLSEVDHARFVQMNDSDRYNPRRLVRAIEIALNPKHLDTREEPLYDTLLVGLTSTTEKLYERIDESVKRRIEEGFQEEVTHLLKTTPINARSMSATGYKQMAQFIQGNLSIQQAIIQWSQSEKQYVKRQMTWFKKQPGIHWFDISQENFRAQVAELVESWHNKS